jgi:hypothetical protein
MNTFISAQRIKDSYSIKAVCADEKTSWWGCKCCDMMNGRHYSNQFKKENVDFDV